MSSKQKIIYKILEKIEQAMNVYWMYSLRPMNSIQISRGLDAFSDSSVAIVLQGPIIYKNNFTYETVKLYLKKYPHCKIIVSTWVDQEKVKWFEDEENVYFCYSEKPNPGRENINMQKTSTVAGIQKAKSLGCSYVLKTRTDQRIYGEEVIGCCLKMIKKYPVNGNVKARGRLITSSIGTFKNRLYNICDMYLFGYIEDMEKYFDVPAVENLPSDFTYRGLNAIEYSKLEPGEIYFAVNYLRSIGHYIKWTVEDSDYARNNYFIVMDNSSLDILWPKYDHKEFRWKSYDANYYLQQCSFSEWMSCQI